MAQGSVQGSNTERPEGFQLPRAGLADGEETTGVIPATVDPAEVEITLGVRPAEIGDVAKAMRALPNGAESDDRELPLQFGMLGAEGQKLLDSRRPVPVFVHLADRFIETDVAIEVEEFSFGLDASFSLDREVGGVDVAVGPVVATSGDHLSQGA